MRLATRRAVVAGAITITALLAPAAEAQYYRANLRGSQEVPPNASTAFGAVFLYRDGSNVAITGTFKGLESTYSASHVHNAPAGVNGPVIWGLNPTLDADQRGAVYTAPPNVLTFTADQLQALTNGTLYVNIHSNALPGGEIRDQLTPAVVINELRLDQPSTDNDEYVELMGPAGASLNGYTYVVIGDGAAGSGVIEYILPLDGQTIPGDGIWLGGGGDDGNNVVLGVTVDFQFDPNFENSDAVTHMIVTGFTGTDQQDLDTDDNGVLETTPWTGIIDAIGFADDVTPDFPYGNSIGYTDLPANGTFPFAHGFRDGDTGSWTGGQFDPAVGNDTPGAPNAVVVANEPGTPASELSLVVDNNPVSHHANIRFELPEAASVRLAVYDATGREIAILVDGDRAAGASNATLDAMSLAPGVYVLRLTAGGQSVSRSVTVVR
jgi:hypothetical protein